MCVWATFHFIPDIPDENGRNRLRRLECSWYPGKPNATGAAQTVFSGWIFLLSFWNFFLFSILRVYWTNCMYNTTQWTDPFIQATSVHSGVDIIYNLIWYTTEEWSRSCVAEWPRKPWSRTICVVLLLTVSHKKIIPWRMGYKSWRSCIPSGIVWTTVNKSWQIGPDVDMSVPDVDGSCVQEKGTPDEKRCVTRWVF